MQHKNSIRRFPFVDKKKLTTLVENRRAFTLSNFEINIYETFEPSALVPLVFSEPVIISMIRGKKVMHLEDTVSFDYHPGETLLLPEYAKMQIDFPEAKFQDPTQCAAIAIDSYKINEVVDYLNEFYPRTGDGEAWSFDLAKFHFSNNEELTRTTNRLMQISLGEDRHKEVLADLVLKQLLVQIMQLQGLLTLRDDAAGGGPFFSYICRYIRDNLSDKLSIEKLSAEVGMSKSSLTRKFKNEIGVSPTAFIIAERITFAKKVLKQTRSIKEACFSAGFSDVNYFVRLFRQREGRTPGQFLRNF